MENKIKRFLELSKEFTVGNESIYGFNSNSITLTAVSGGSYAEYRTETPTPLGQFIKAQEDKIEKAKRYNEYLELQSSLLEYYNALEKLK